MTKDTDNRVSLYDVLKAQRVEDLGIRDFDEEVKRRSQVTMKYILTIVNLNLNNAIQVVTRRITKTKLQHQVPNV